MVSFEKATPEDAASLAQVSKRAFHSDTQYGAPKSAGGPPGYDSDTGQLRLMLMGEYYKILKDGHIVGGIIFRPLAYQHYELTRIFVDSLYQRQGIGTRAIAFIEALHPEVKRWRLGTPKWNTRTPCFYESCGFVQIGTDRGGLLYEKTKA
ncbi:MAG: GNAT family N-acetyltransferase [Anaerolineae bacterium]|nr:GNAT family N-acetyltransferase [Anaerolineae bacterium]